MRYCQSEVEKIISQENITVFLRTGEASETPALFALSEDSFFLGLFNKNGVFEGQYLFSSESKALKWGRELFEYYVESSEKVSSTNFS
jgi:predicted transcriptional regulator